MTFASPFMAVLRGGDGHDSSATPRGLAERESPAGGRGQAACSSSGSSSSARVAASRSAASGMQVPQHDPAPVRMVSSAIELHPAVAAWQISWSVTALQMQTYTAEGDYARSDARRVG